MAAVLGLLVGLAIRSDGTQATSGLTGTTYRNTSGGGDSSVYDEQAGGTVALAGFHGFLSQAAAHLGTPQVTEAGSGEYLFLPNRRTVWVIHPKTGRFANYHFRDDLAGTVEVSRVVTIDQQSFPPEDTVYLLSDRNLSEVLWTCNTRTGDVQMWTPRSDGRVVAEKPITTKIDLMPRAKTTGSPTDNR